MLLVRRTMLKYYVIVTDFIILGYGDNIFLKTFHRQEIAFLDTKLFPTALDYGKNFSRLQHYVNPGWYIFIRTFYAAQNFYQIKSSIILAVLRRSV